MACLISLRRLASLNPISYGKSFKVLSSVLCRNLASDDKVKWVRPPNIPSYDPSLSGDLTPFQIPTQAKWADHFETCKLLETEANDNVKKIFTITNQSKRHQFYVYKMSLINKVKDHDLDTSVAVRIAALTARIRILQHVMKTKRPSRKLRAPLNLMIHKRRKFLKILREVDYKKFEWILEKLDLKFYPVPIRKERITRKKSTKLLAEYRKEKLKEFKLSEHKKSLDLEKVPFLEKKLKILKQIKEQEATFQLEPTVTDSDIETCIEQIEKVKIQVKENQKKGYMRKVHPYTLEIYDPDISEKSETN